MKSFSDKYNVYLLVVHHTRKMESADAFDMISGTNGLLGAADGAFILHKKKRTDKEAIMEVVGRDQQDQEITLEFDMEFCRWNYIKSETELWKPKPDPILNQIAEIFTEEIKEWKGTSSDLIELLPDLNLKPNALTRKLNISVDRLYNEYGIYYENNRNHDGRYIILKKSKLVTIGDDCDGIFECVRLVIISSLSTQSSRKRGKDRIRFEKCANIRRTIY